MTVAPDTSRLPYTRVLVYTSSSSFDQSTPAFTFLRDNIALVTSMGFTDKDLDLYEIGGYITWTSAGAVSLISSYVVYIAMDSIGTSKSQLGTDVPVGTNALLLNPEFKPGNFYFLLVYTKSSLVEQSGNAAIGIYDIESKVGEPLSFTDPDLMAQIV